MNIQCTLDGLIPEAAKKAAIRRAGFRFARFEPVIRDVRIIIQDVNGPRGGRDIRCLVWVRFPRLPSVIIQEMGESVAEAASHAIDRAAQNTRRLVSYHHRGEIIRHRRVDRQSRRHPLWSAADSLSEEVVS